MHASNGQPYIDTKSDKGIAALAEDLEHPFQATENRDDPGLDCTAHIMSATEALYSWLGLAPERSHREPISRALSTG